MKDEPEERKEGIGGAEQPMLILLYICIYIYTYMKVCMCQLEVCGREERQW